MRSKAGGNEGEERKSNGSIEVSLKSAFLRILTYQESWTTERQGAEFSSEEQVGQDRVQTD